MLFKEPKKFGKIQKVLKSTAAADDRSSPTFFEELTCVGYNPENNDLMAVVQIKQIEGYGGGPCGGGTQEYVRFFVDYERNGTWINEGVVSFIAYDLPLIERLSYVVKLRLDPKKQTCCNKEPVLPRVRAILQSQEAPPEDDPDFQPDFGNVVEANIQIAPVKNFWCFLEAVLVDQGIKIKEDVILDIEKVFPPKWIPEIPKEPELPDIPFPPPPPPPPFFKKVYGKKVEDARIGFKMTKQVLKETKTFAMEEAKLKFETYGLKVADIVNFIIESEFNTKYEEVKCLGLNRDLNMLYAGILVKLPYGYMGNLCEKGSREYVAFYMDFGDGWEYKGTSSVGVHDIPEIPADGLWYNVSLPVELSKYQKAACESGIAKVRAILSWEAPPPPNDPNYIATWGDWEECHVEIKPLPPGVPEGEMVPFIEHLGGIRVSQINGMGYADDEGLDRPFGGIIELRGLVTEAPNYSETSEQQLRYRIMVKRPSSMFFQASLEKFKVDVTKYNGMPIQYDILQEPNDQGWLDYLPDWAPPTIINVSGPVLGRFRVAEDGLHEVYIEVYDPNDDRTLQSNIVRFMVDVTPPEADVEITSGNGNCGRFPRGTTIDGSFYMKDTHCRMLRLTVTPSGPANNEKPKIYGIDNLNQLTYPTDLSCPVTAGTWELDTANMNPCGYNIRIEAWDRTIINSLPDAHLGYKTVDIEGFCLTAPD
jgi:hypothetical protein